jgi:hypothetical protein
VIGLFSGHRLRRSQGRKPERRRSSGIASEWERSGNGADPREVKFDDQDRRCVVDEKPNKRVRQDGGRGARHRSMTVPSRRPNHPALWRVPESRERSHARCSFGKLDRAWQEQGRDCRTRRRLAVIRSGLNPASPTCAARVSSFRGCRLSTFYPNVSMPERGWPKSKRCHASSQYARRAQLGERASFFSPLATIRQASAGSGRHDNTDERYIRWRRR